MTPTWPQGSLVFFDEPTDRADEPGDYMVWLRDGTRTFRRILEWDDVAEFVTLHALNRSAREDRIVPATEIEHVARALYMQPAGYDVDGGAE